MAITLGADALGQTLDRAYLLAIGDGALPGIWLTRAEQLAESPSVAYVAAVGAVLLAKATNDAIDAFVIQVQEGSAGAFSLRAPATVLASKRRALGYDIGSSSDRDPINHGTLVSSKRWDLALDRILDDHKPFFSYILTWLHDVNRLTSTEATEALAAYIRVRRRLRPGIAADRVPSSLAVVPALTDLVELLEGFIASDTERGARGMALVAAAYRAVGFEAQLPSRNDPRRIDIAIKRDGALVIGSEVKQVDTMESTADTLARDTAEARAQRALLAVLPPGALVDFDRTSVIRRAEREHRMVLRVTGGVRELLHETLSSGTVGIDQFCRSVPRAFAHALRDMRAADAAIETWAAIASRWQ